MTDFQPPEPQQNQNPLLAGTGTTVTPPLTQAKKSNRNVFIFIGVSLILICLCVGVTGLTIGKGIVMFNMEQPKVENVIDEYMTAMADKDASQAYKLLSTRAKRNVSLADNEILLEGNNYVLFEGYLSVTLASLTLNTTFDTDPDMPQGVVAEVDGMISYADGFTGDFTAVLEREGEEWRLYSINLSVPPNKLSH